MSWCADLCDAPPKGCEHFGPSTAERVARDARHSATSSSLSTRGGSKSGGGCGGNSNSGGGGRSGGGGGGGSSGGRALAGPMPSSAWLQQVAERQSARMTPEVRQRLEQRAAAQLRAAESATRSAELSMCSAQTRQVWARGMRSMTSPATATPALRAAAEQEARSEMLQLRSVMTGAGDRHQRAQQLEALQVRSTTADGGEADGSEIASLLQQLRTEPSDDAERLAKFRLYEQLLETVEEARKQTFAFFAGCKEDFAAGGAGPLAAAEAALAAIDKAENLQCHFRDDRWFVFDMSRSADRNSTRIERVLAELTTKLGLIASMDADCPVCLEPLAAVQADGGDITTLGCCHKVCADCWTQWQAVKHGHAFCPLCKHDEFLDEVQTRAARLSRPI